MPLGIATVRGDSMRPLLCPGDRLVVRYRSRPQAGDLALARFVDGTVVVKRVAEPRRTRTGAPGWWLLSENPDAGVDSRHRGVIAERDVLGVVRARLWPRPRWWRRPPVRPR